MMRMMMCEYACRLTRAIRERGRANKDVQSEGKGGQLSCMYTWNANEEGGQRPKHQQAIRVNAMAVPGSELDGARLE